MNKPSQSYAEAEVAGLRPQIEKLELEASGASDEHVRYQVQTHEHHNDFSWSFDVWLYEYRTRGLREVGDWQDAGEILAGA